MSLLIIAAVYLIGAYVAAFIIGYFDYEPPFVGASLWPLYVAAYLVLAALIPFFWIGESLYNAGSALRGRP